MHIRFILAAAILAPSFALAAPDALGTTVAALDTAAFDSFNRCADKAQLDRHAAYFAPDVEFYHDQGGVMWSREAVIASTKAHICGKVRRELVAGTLEVFPIKDFGAIARGQHRFCEGSTGRCDGLADFTIVWRLKEGKWEMTRVLSYAHRPNT